MLRKFCTDLANAKNNNPEFKNALKFVKRWHENVLLNDLSESDQPTKNRFCESVAVRKAKVPEVREVIFEWFIDVRETLKRILPLKVLEGFFWVA